MMLLDVKPLEKETVSSAVLSPDYNDAETVQCLYFFCLALFQLNSKQSSSNCQMIFKSWSNF